MEKGEKTNFDIMLELWQGKFNTIIAEISSVDFQNRTALSPHLKNLIIVCGEIEASIQTESQRLQAEKLLLNFQSQTLNQLPYALVHILEDTLANIINKKI